MEVQRSLHGESNRILSRDMTEQMLEPVLNDYGLGFGVFERGDRRYFGHGGSNQGFRCRLVASVEGGFGAVVMTNGERGDDLVDELLRAIAAEYGWAGFESEERQAIPFDAAMTEQLAGVYEIPGGGEVKVFEEGGKLRIDGLIFSKEPLYASEPDRLFLLNGLQLEVERAADGSVAALASGPIVANKK
jgi:hypothetical protein